MDDILKKHKANILAILYEGMSHEIGNYLNLISMLNIDMARQAKLSGHKNYEDSCMQVDEYIRQCNSILRFPAELSNDRKNNSKANIHEVIRELLPLFKSHRWIVKKGLKISAQLSPELNNVTVSFNRLRLIESILPIIFNAVEATQFRGRIAIATNLNNRAQTMQKICIEIQDNGPGIPLEYHDKIFSIFTTKPHGTGIGLYIANKIIKEEGGSIDFETKLGKGTCFRVCVPAVQKHDGY